MLNQERYNQEIDEIKKSVDQALIDCDIDEQYREAVYNSVYGFKVAVAEPYGIDMEYIYGNLSQLGAIHENAEKIPKGAKGLCCYLDADEDGNQLRDNRPTSIYISPEISEDKDYVQRVVSHELLHLYSFNHVNKSHNLGNASMVEECVTEAINDKVLSALSIEGKTKDIPIYSELSEASDATIKSYSGGYHMIVPLYESVTRLYPEDELIKVKFGAQEPYSHDRQTGLASLSMDLERVNKGNRVEDYGMFYRNLAGQLFDSYNKSGDFSRYLPDAREIRENSPSVNIGGTVYKISDIAFEEREVSSLYSNSFGRNSLQNNLNVTTRTVDCQDFLKALSIAKQVDDDFSMKDLTNIKTSRIMHNGEPSVAIKIGEHTYVAPQVNGADNVVCGVGNKFSEEPITVKAGFHLASTNNDASNFALLSQMNAAFNGGFMTRGENAGQETLIAASAGLIPLRQDILTKAIEKNDVANIHDAHGHNLLHGAASSVVGLGFMDALKRVDSQTFTSMLREKDNSGMSPIDIMCAGCNTYALRFVTDSTTLTKEDTIHLFDRRDINGESKTPIIEIMRGDEKLAAKLLSSTGNVEMNGTTPLHGAVHFKSLKMINAIGSDGIDIKDKNGQTALNTLIFSNQPTEVKRNLSLVLLENGANPNIPASNGASPLAQIIQDIYKSSGQDRENNMSMFKDLLEHGADPNQKLEVKINGEEKEITPAQVALQMHKFDTFELMTQSVEVANIDERQNAPTLTEALPTIEIVETMVDFGMDVMMKTRNFDSVMEFADGTGGLAIIKAVMESGAGVEELTEMIGASGSFRGLDMSSLIESISSGMDIGEIESIINNLQLDDSEKTMLSSIVSDCVKEIEAELDRVAETEALEAEEDMVMSLKMFD